MILLLGGTSETASLAGSLADRGYRVLVSMATDIPLEIGKHPNISQRTGRLNGDEMAVLVREEGFRAIVDATHPYASSARASAKQVARRMDIPYLTLIRPKAVKNGGGACFASDHEQAARIACSQRGPVFLTIGSTNLEPYVQEGRQTGVHVIVRILSHPEAFETCRRLGILGDSVIAGRGPFSVEENRTIIRKFGVRVLVTKDSGQAGGVRAKLDAARLEGCQVVIVRRPNYSSEGAFEKVEELIHALAVVLPKETVSP